MTELEARLNRIERSLRRWRRAAVSCALLICCVPLMGQAKPRKSTALVVDHLTVRDSKGRARVVIAGNGRVSFRNSQGEETGSLDENGLEFHATDPLTNKHREVFLKGPKHGDWDGGGIGILNAGRSVFMHIGSRGPEVAANLLGEPRGAQRTRSSKTTALLLEGIVITEDHRAVESLIRPR